MSSRHRNLPLLLLKARDGLMAHFRPIFNEHELTEQQWRIIRVLTEHGDLEPRELCRICNILSPSITGILKRMNEMELIEKLPMLDQRRVIIRLTPKSRELAKQITERNEQVYQQLERLVSKKTMDELYLALDQVIQKLNS